MKYIIFTSLIFLCINVQAQTIINVDSSNTINIYNNGTLIENNQGTVNISTESGRDEELRMPDDLGKVTEPKDKNVHFIYTDDYKFAGDKVKINGKVYMNIDIMKSTSGKHLFEIIGSEAHDHSQREESFRLKGLTTYTEGNVLYVSRYKNCNDEYDSYYIIDELSIHFPSSVTIVYTIGGVVIRYDSPLEVIMLLIGFIIFMAIITWIHNKSKL